MKKHMVNKVVKLVSKVFVTLVVVISIMITNSDKLLISAAQSVAT